MQKQKQQKMIHKIRISLPALSLADLLLLGVIGVVASCIVLPVDVVVESLINENSAIREEYVK